MPTNKQLRQKMRAASTRLKEIKTEMEALKAERKKCRDQRTNLKKKLSELPVE
ncbi:hypothetical protein [Maricaulis maris]|uniref:hypothetical protein n=1 Tax=Maricaulis maris TaxID=74318 RepID=UPI003B8D9748